jgi:hypothetical protein
MFTGARPILATALITATTACGGQVIGRSTEATPRGPSNGATVLHARQLNLASSNLLGAISGRIAGLQIRPSRTACPEITIRGRTSLLGDNNPVIYVDGTRAANTCVLDMIPPMDVQRVEIYPTGVAPRLPYQAHPNGLILVFLEDGSS